MKKTILGRMSVLLFAIFAFFAFFNPQTSKAQYELYGWPTYWIWYNTYYGYIKNVAVYNQTGLTYGTPLNYTTSPNQDPAALGTQIYENKTGADFYKHYKLGWEMKVGSRYGVRVATGAFPTWYNYGYTRVYIDLNADGDFFDVNEYRGMSSYVFYYDTQDFHTYFNNIDITCSTPAATSRIRAIRSPIYSTDPRVMGYDYTYLGYGFYNLGECEDYDIEFVPDAPASYPAEYSILYANEWYDGTVRVKNGNNVTFTKPSAYFRSAQPAGTSLRYAIVGPLPATDTVYRALDPITGSTTITNGVNGVLTWTPSRATGKTGYFTTNGNFNGVLGGEYKLVIEVGGAGCPGASVRLFTCSLDDDMAASSIEAPKSSDAPKFFKYKRGTNVPVTGVYQNVGINEVRKFTAKAFVYRPDGSLADSMTYNYDADNNPGDQVIKPGAKVNIAFGTIKYNQVGVYSIVITSDYIYEIAAGAFNNRFPRAGSPKYNFEYQYDIQLKANAIMKPAEGELIIANKPFKPFAEFINLGISDASNVPTKIEFWFNGAKELEVPAIAEDVPQGRYNTKIITYAQTRLSKPGVWTAKIYINHPDDEVESDNVLEHDFIVETGVQGTFTVGLLNETDFNKQFKNDRNFQTIEEAMNAVYFYGLSGSVKFVLTDAVYDVTSLRANSPAWDMSSEILGLGYNKDINETFTMTWTASKNQRAATTINLNTTNGKGIYIGQNVNPSNTNAPFTLFSNPKSANNGGYITFDGGSQKGLKFVLKKIQDANGNVDNNVKHGSVFYLTQGSNNITIKNCIIDNAVTAVKANTQLPSVIYGLSGFVFDLDQMQYPGSIQKSYSSGIVIRSRLFTQSENTSIPVDTVLSSNNVITGNEISNFAYGVTSIGIGQLFVNAKGVFEGFYNQNNLIEGNKIYNVTRAGVYAGNEQSIKIKNNRIYNVGDGASDAYGVLLGGNTTTRARGYQTIGAVIDGNEISGLTSPVAVAGVKVEQVQISYPTGTTPMLFPRLDEATEVYNNNVWGLDITNANATIAGIHLTTERKSASVNDLLTGYYVDYFSANDRVYNNTVVIQTPSTRSQVATVGIGIQNAYAARVINNAVALTDNNDLGLYSAALLYQGTSPNWGRNIVDKSTVKGNKNINKGIYSNSNVFWLGFDNSKQATSSLVRYIETKLDGTILSTGFKQEYVTLDQWQSWTGADEQSYYYNFVSDMELVGNNPQNYTIKSSPFPIGSKLNNNGVVLVDNKKDLSGAPRGVVAQRYDIGAIEFNGRQYTIDLQSSEVIEPREYQSVVDANFSDAQYIMTTAPVNVKSRIHNNGTLQQAGAKAKLEIKLQGIDGVSYNTVLTKEVIIDVASNEHLDVDFLLANGDADDFVPQTYGDLNYAARQNQAPEYTIPTLFTTMADNVTPLYKVVVSVESDQLNNNNVTEKSLRFYIKKSELNMIVSGVNTSEDITFDPAVVPQAKLIGKLNYDALTGSLAKLGWYSDWTANKHKVDYFDRNSWEPRAVNYDNYVHLVWSDGQMTGNDRITENVINRFLNSSTESWLKKNLIIASQEWAQVAANTPFAQDVLRAKFLNGNANGNGTTYLGRQITGTNVARDRKFNITRPQYYDFMTSSNVNYPTDVDPFPAVLQVLNTDANGSLLPGVSKDAFKYTGTADNNTSRVMGVATTTLEQNIVYLGADWRHFGDVETVLRGVVDYLERNGSDIIPVELTSFEAAPNAQSVELSWVTSSENNSAKFIVERANVVNDVIASFDAINEVKAAGHSVTPKAYTTVDAGVQYGNTYAYRLKVVDIDGVSKYSDDVRIVTLTGLAGYATMTEAMPNPTINVAKFEYTLSSDMNVTISVYDVNGNVISTTEEFAKAGINNYEASFTSYASGVYTVVLRAGDLVITRSVSVSK